MRLQDEPSCLEHAEHPRKSHLSVKRRRWPLLRQRFGGDATRGRCRFKVDQRANRPVCAASSQKRAPTDEARTTEQVAFCGQPTDRQRWQFARVWHLRRSSGCTESRWHMKFGPRGVRRPL